MLTVRIDFNEMDGTHFVVMDGGVDVYFAATRERADDYIAYQSVEPTEDDLMPIVTRARNFAKTMHGDQMHGCLPMEEHLRAVADLVHAHAIANGDSPWEAAELEAAAWLHDIMEDTPVTFDLLENQFGFHVACMVDMLTDRPGATRFERHLNTYHRIREYGADAVLIKLADRAHNHARSIQYNEHYLDMYLSEYPYFKMALWRPNQHVKLWELLDSQYTTMKGMRDGAGLQKGSGISEDAGTGGA